MTLATTAALPRCVSRNMPAFTGSVNIAGCARPGANDRAVSKGNAKEIGDGGGAAAAWPPRRPGYGPSHRGQDARVPDHARDDAAGAAREARHQLPAGAQVREGPQPDQPRAVARGRTSARGRARLLLQGARQGQAAPADGPAAPPARLGAELRRPAPAAAGGALRAGSRAHGRGGLRRISSSALTFR